MKKKFITAIKKQLSLYGSFSYFSGEIGMSNLKLLTWSNFLKFLVEKKIFKVKLKITARANRWIRGKNESQ